MRILRPVVLTQTLLMAARETQLTSCGSIGAQLVGHKLVWSEALLLQQLAHEPQGSLGVALGLDQQIQHLALTIDGSPQVHTPALDPDHHLTLSAKSGCDQLQGRKARHTGPSAWTPLQPAHDP